MPVAAIAALHVALAGTPSSAQANYTVTTISGLQDLAATGARGVNNAGDIVGVDGATEAYPPCGLANEDAAFLDKLGTITEFVVYQGCYSLAQGISTKGTIVGYAAPQGNQIAGFIRLPDGTISTFTYPGAAYSRFLAINPKATEIVGSEYNGSFHGLIYKGGTLTVYDVPVSANNTVLRGVDDAGDVVGEYDTSVANGFAVIGGSFTTVNVPNATGTSVYGINNNHAMVGTYTDSSNVSHGFIRTPAGKIKSFDVPGATSTSLAAMNAKGEVVGRYIKNGTSYAFYAVKAK